MTIFLWLVVLAGIGLAALAGYFIKAGKYPLGGALAWLSLAFLWTFVKFPVPAV